MRIEKVPISAYVRIWRGRPVSVQTYEGNRLISDKVPKLISSHYCRKCGARVQTRKMSNGGLVVFEAIPGLRSVKHPCYSLGDQLSAAKDTDTLDLFASAVEPESEDVSE